MGSHAGSTTGSCLKTSSTSCEQCFLSTTTSPAASDAASRSELVVPLFINDELVGVLDIDSPSLDRFSEADQAGVEALCKSFCESQKDFSI